MSGHTNFALESDNGSTVAADQVTVEEGSKSTGSKKFSPEEEQILEVLRDVVRKCTNPDPNKRPTAAAVLELLNACPVTVK